MNRKEHHGLLITEKNNYKTDTNLYNRIKKMVLSGEIRSGERISEEKIANILGVSRTPVREALRQLEIYGLIYIKPKSYAEVICLDEEEIDEIAAVRANLEALAVKTLISHINKTDKAVLEAAEKACRTAFSGGDIAEVFEKDSLLHLEIAKRSKNRCLYDTLERLDHKVQLYRISKCLNMNKLKGDINRHKDIIQAICTKNADLAVDLMTRHVLEWRINKYNDKEQ